jgi:hypothetical protein
MRALLALSTSLFVFVASTPAAELDIRDDNGNVLIAARDIRSYDWPTHTITLAPNVRTALAAELLKTRRLVSGVPFAVCLDGKPLYDGKFTISASSFSFATPVIVLDPIAQQSDAIENRLRIQLGYPTEEFFKGDDPRDDARIDAALRAAGKLTNSRNVEHTRWIADVLREIQTLKPGMTREDLLKIFTEEGGLSNRFQRRYVHRDCPYIKVDFKFDPAPESHDEKFKEHPRDKITQISTPFLEWTIHD